MMLDKLELIPHEKIIVSFGYYVINQNNIDSFFVYSNSKGSLILFYKDESEEYMFIETCRFQKLDKKGLFFFLADSMSENFIDNKILEANAIESYTKADFNKTISYKDILNNFMHLTPTDIFKDNPVLGNICYNREGINCAFVYSEGNLDNTPSDIISFGENTEQVDSYFGSRGYYLDCKSEKPLIFTYHPLFLNIYDLDDYSFAITQYDISSYDFISILEKTKHTNIIIPADGINSLIYKSRTLLYLYGFLCDINFEFKLYLNQHYFDIDFSFITNEETKSNLIKLFSEIKQTALDSVKYQEDINTISSFYDFSITPFSTFHKYTIGKITIKNTLDTLSSFNSKFAKYLTKNYNLIVK